MILCRVNDLLDLSTLDKGVFTPKLKVFDWRSSVEEVVNINASQALYKDIKLSHAYTSTMPRYIRTDDTRMQQVLINYLGNAIKFTSKGTI